MTPREFRAALREIEREIGPKARVSVGFNFNDSHPALFAVIYPDRNNYDDYVCADNDNDFGAILAKIRSKWAEHRDRHRVERTREMALEIIRLTALHGACTDAALRMKFDTGEVAELGNAACAEAERMASHSPFRIVTAGVGNGAPAEAAE